MHNPRLSGRRAFLAVCALVAPLTSVMLPAARAQGPVAPQTSLGDRIINEIDIRGARMESAVSVLGTQNGVTNIVILNEPGKNFGLVTVKLVDQPVRRVLEAIALSAGAVVEDRDGIFYIRHKNAQDDAPKPQEPKAPAPTPEVVAVPVARPRANRQFARIPLTYLQASVFVKMLQDPAYLSVFETTVPHHEPPLRFGSPTNMVQPLEVPQSGNPVAPSPQFGQPTTPPVVGVPGGSAGRDGGEAGARGQGLRGGGGFGGGGFQGGGGFGGGGGFQGGGPGGGGFQGGGAPGQGGGGQNALPDGINSIIASDAQNALIVEWETAEGLNDLRELIRLLDVAPQQVQIRAEFVAVNISDADSFGIDWRFQPAGNLDVAIPPESGTQPTITMAYASGNAVANLRASLIRSTGNVLQAPIISTVNNRPASINFSDTVTIPQTVNIVGANGQIVSGTQFVPVTAFNGLTVAPHINGDGTITMFLTPQLSTIDTQANGGIRSTSQALTTTRRIRNGETMVLGGFITKQESRTLRKVPLLSDLPIIGSLFQQRSRTVVGSEVLVFVTATIIEETEGGNAVGGGGLAPTP